MNNLFIAGGGLAGCEAAWQAAKLGVSVTLVEMRPKVKTPVHKTSNLAELVCSNSLGSSNPQQAGGILKNELMRLGSLIIEAAHFAKVPAGQALAVDRDIFSSYIEEKITLNPLITLVRSEITNLPENRPLIIATGPMTSDSLAGELSRFLGNSYLYFYDAVSPVVSTESLDPDYYFKGSRYNKGEAEYINCFMTKKEYELFLDALLKAEKAPVKEHENKFFEGCLPVEEIASRGPETLRFGPMKPVGLSHPDTGEEFYAVVQLRQENKAATCYNLVGFQTRLKWSEQVKVFRMIPALRNAEFLRLGVMHRNIFVNAPQIMEGTGLIKEAKDIFIAGQLSGVEGYIESTASGLVCGINGARLIQGRQPLLFPAETAIGALMNHLTGADVKNFQPMNINMGLFPPLEKRFKKKQERNEAIALRADASMNEFLQEKRISS